MNWPLETLWQEAQSLGPVYARLELECLPQVGSTNQVLLQRAREGRRCPCLLVAESQTAGRGRMGKDWHTQPAGQALTFSLGLPYAPQDWMGLSLLVGLAMVEALDPKQTLGLQLKWPNDIWWRGQKLGGILVETVLQTHGGRSHNTPPEIYAVIGVGLNIFAPPQGQHYRTTPAALQDLIPDITAPKALGMVVPLLLRMLPRFASTGFAPWQGRYRMRDALWGKTIQLSTGASGQAQGVDAQGALLLDTLAGMQTIKSGEVSVFTPDRHHP